LSITKENVWKNKPQAGPSTTGLISYSATNKEEKKPPKP
jgi:hypothetical protein